MPSFEEIVQYLTGAWQLMLGREDGLRKLDVSVDGFWNSFYAIAVAFPALFLSWVAHANAYMPVGESKMAWILQLALVELAGWIIPLIALAIAAKPAGILDRFVHFVVATNWASALIAWIAVPAPLLRLFFPSGEKMAINIGLLIFMIMMVLLWRLTNATLQKGPIVATAVFIAMTALSVTVMVWLQNSLGLVPV